MNDNWMKKYIKDLLLSASYVACQFSGKKYQEVTDTNISCTYLFEKSFT